MSVLSGQMASWNIRILLHFHFWLLNCLSVSAFSKFYYGAYLLNLFGSIAQFIRHFLTLFYHCFAEVSESFDNSSLGV